jgi:CBS domain-containing protein
MHTVQSILAQKGGEVLRIEGKASVLHAAEVMNRQHIGALVVTRGDTVVGIVTERDVMNRVVAKRRDPATVHVEEVMSAPVAVCGPSSSRSECRSVMKNHRIRHLPVVDEGRLIGMISIGDILEDEGAENEETIRYLYEYMYGAWQPSMGLGQV